MIALRLLFALWLCSLPILTAIHLPTWRDDRSIWAWQDRWRPTPRSNYQRQDWEALVRAADRDRDRRRPFAWRRGR